MLKKRLSAGAAALTFMVGGVGVPAANGSGLHFDISASAATIIDSGKCGENVSWMIDKEGTLTISGSGAMEEYDDYISTPWYRNDRSESIKKVIIKNGVTKIGSCAFQECINLTDITLPDSIVSIGNYAFLDCKALASINIPDNLASIGTEAFYACESLKSITLPDSVIKIGYGAFYWCTSLISIRLSDSVMSIEDYTFANCSKLTSINLPVSVTSIGENAFKNCESLKSIELPDGVKSIKKAAFIDCTSLKNIKLPKSVTSIGEKALGYISVSNKLAGFKISCYKNTAAEQYAIDNGFDYELVDGAKIVNSGTCGTNVSWTLDSAGTLTISGTGAMTDYNAGKTPWYDNRDSVKKVIIKNGVTSVGKSAFDYCEGLLTAEIPDSITSIGISAFSGCKSLTALTIPDNVASIGDFAFTYCDSLKSITVSSGNANFKSVDGVLYNKSLTEIRCCPGGKTAVTIQSSVTKIGRQAFQGCSNLKSITIPDSVTSIGDDAFIDCSSLTSLTIPNSVKSIGMNVFMGCDNLKSITLPEGLYKISACMLEHCGNLTDVTIPGNVKTIEFCSFEYCTSLAEVTIPDSVKTIEEDAFHDCRSLKSITIPKSVESIGEHAFGYINYNFVKLDGFKIYCYPGTAGEQYAKDNGFDYELLDNQNDISECAVTLSPTSFTYDGTVKKPAVTVKDGSTTLKAGTDYTVTYPTDCTTSGVKTITVKGAGNYTGDVSKTYVINPKAISGATISANQTSFTYNGNEQKPAVTLTDGTRVLVNGTDYTVTYPTDCTNSGTKTITINGTGNYTGSVSNTYTISQKPISGTTISADKTTFTYDGTEKKPAVTVRDGSATLKNGTDYTVTYPADCKSAGSKTVTVKGTGNYTGSVSNTYTINQKPISETTIKADRTAFTYDGNEKKPVFTITDGSKTLVSGTDYTVTYPKDAVNTGTKTVIITGKGNYTGQVSGTYSIAIQPFTWGRDNWSFDNTAFNFKWNYNVNDNVKKQMKADFGLSDRDIVELESEIAKSSAFNGSCFGMTISEILASQRQLDLSRYGGNSVVNKNSATSDITSVINFIQHLQYNVHMLQAVRQAPFLSGIKTQQDYITTLAAEAASNKYLIKVGYQITEIKRNVNTGKSETSEVRHAVLAYGAEDCKYYSPVTGMTYDKRILIADPNHLSGNKLNDEACIYYRSSDKSWIIPCRNETLSGGITRRCYWNADAGTGGGEILNLYRYKTLTEVENLMCDFTVNPDEHYISGLTIENQSGNTSIVEQVKETGNPNSEYLGDYSKTGIARYDAEFADEMYIPKNEEMYALWNSTANYTLSYAKPSDISFKMDYQSVDYYMDVTNVTYAYFKPTGYIAVRGSDSDYSLKMVADDDEKVNDWYALTVKGGSTDSLELKKTDGGYMIKSNDLGKVKLKAESPGATAETTLSTKYKSAFIYEINKNTIGIKVDKDNNGTYETDITRGVPVIKAEPEETAIKLTWSAVPNATKYAVCGLVNGKWTNLAEGTGTSYTIKNLTGGKDYVVAVIAMKDGKWENDLSNAVTVRLAQPKPVYPIVTTIDYNEEYHQFKINWSAVPNAEQYGIAVKIGNKWKIQTYVSGKTTSFISPKLTPGKTYEMVVCAKVNGEWDTSKILNRAVKVTVK